MFHFSIKLHIIVLFLICISVSRAFSQNFRWLAEYDFIGDNREFTTSYGYPETILASRVSAEIGYQLDSNQTFMCGGSYLLTHGGEMFEQTPILTMYYQFKNKFLDFQLGSFPIETPTFSKILYTDSLIYYRPNYQGARAIFTHKYGQQTILFDWMNQVDAGYVEKFLSGISGITHLKRFFIKDMFYYRHHAEGSIGKKSVADNGGWELSLGYNLPINWFDSLSISEGIVNTWYNNTKEMVEPLRSLGSYSNIYLKKRFIGLDATYYYGDGTNLPYGDPLYRCGNYGRLDAILYILNRPNVKASFRFCTHYIDGTVDVSQQIYLRAKITNRK